MKKILVFIFLCLLNSSMSHAENSYFIDFNKVLNKSNVGAESQTKLKKKYTSEAQKFEKIEKNIRDEEKKIISQKKVITQEEYQKKVEELRKKVSELQKNKRNSLNNIADSRSKAKTTLLKAVNPIINKYMVDNKIRIVLDKKSVLMGDTNLEITDQIIAILNKELKSLKVN